MRFPMLLCGFPCCYDAVSLDVVYLGVRYVAGIALT